MDSSGWFFQFPLQGLVSHVPVPDGDDSVRTNSAYLWVLSVDVMLS